RGKPLRRCSQRARCGGGGPRRVGASENERKVAGLVALGGTAEPLEPLVWEQQETYAQALAAVEARTSPHTGGCAPRAGCSGRRWRPPTPTWTGPTGPCTASPSPRCGSEPRGFPSPG